MKLFKLSIGLVIVLSAFLFMTTKAKALDTIFVVDTLNHTADANTSDDLCADSNGDCSLRAAIQQASYNWIQNPVIINFDPGITGTIAMDTVLGNIENNITINGPGSENLTLEMNAQYRITNIYDLGGSGEITVNITGLTFKDGYNPSGGGAGCVAILGETIVTFDDVIFDNCENHSNSGAGAVLAGGNSLTIYDSVFKNNYNINDGGALALGSDTKIVRSSFLNNISDGNGGAITINDTSFSPYLVIENSTFVENMAANNGGAINNENVSTGSTAEFSNLTVYANVADYDQNNIGDGGGFYNNEIYAYIKNTIIAGNVDLTNSGTIKNGCAGGITLISEGYNLIDNDCTNILGDLASNILDQDPLLGYPKSHGGNETPIMGLLEGSPAIDAGNPAGCLNENDVEITVDQRQSSRTQNGRCDIGAFEGTLFTSFYYFPAYRHETPDKLAYVNFINSSTTNYAAVHVYAGNEWQRIFWVAPEETKTFTLPGVAGESLTLLADEDLRTTLRTEVFGTINEFAGITKPDLDNVYYYPAYRWENPDKKAWINVGNPSNDTDANVEIFIGGISRGTYIIGPGERISEKFEDAVGEDVKIISDIDIYSTLKTLINGYGNEFQGITEEATASSYYFPAYRWQNPDKKAWIIIGNPSLASTVNAEVFVGGESRGIYQINVGERISLSFDDVVGEQVEIQADNSMYATLKMRVGDAGDEYAGIKLLSNEFHYPWYEYDDPDQKAWVIIGNPNLVESEVSIYIDGALRETTIVPAEGRISLSYPDIIDPSTIKIIADNNLYSTLKVIKGNSLNEYPGIVF